MPKPLVSTKIFADHILKQLKIHREKFANLTKIPPLFIAMQGPQGSGNLFYFTL